MRNHRVPPQNKVAKQLTPYDVMRLQNCKSYKFRNYEIYPSIKPPISECNPYQTAAWLAENANADDCGHVDPKLLESKYLQLSNNKVELNAADATDCPPQKSRARCKSDKRKKRTEINLEQLTQRNLDWNNMTPYDLMRLQNCQTYNYQKCETYPNIRPPQSFCDEAESAAWLVEAVNNDGCGGHYFDMEHDDIVDVWKQIPEKQSLGYYGVGSDIAQPEAIVFNDLISKCLRKAAPEHLKMPEVEMKPQQPCKTPKELKTALPGTFVLNRELLQAKICRMPTVQQKLDAHDALGWKYCTRSMKSTHPFVDVKPKVSPEGALGMDTAPSTSTKHDLRRKYDICELQCGIPENMCTEYEWRKYKQDPGPVAYTREMEQLKPAVGTEPRNYEELYDELICCFQKNPCRVPLSKIYDKCCDVGSGKAGGAENDGDGGSGSGGGGGTGVDSGVGGGSVDMIDADADGDNKGDGRLDGHDGKAGEVNSNNVKGPHGPGDEKGDVKQDVKPDGEGEKTGGEGTSGGATGGGGTGGGGKGGGGKGGGGKGGKSDDKKPGGDGHQGSKKPHKTGSGRHHGKGSSDSHLHYPSRATGSQASKISADIKKDRVGKDNKKGKGKGGGSCDSSDGAGGNVKDCPCEICEVMNRPLIERDPPFIIEMKREEKKRILRDYLKLMCHRQRQQAKTCAPQHKCDPIQCDFCFCHRITSSKYCERLGAIQELHKLLRFNPKARSCVTVLRNELCRRFCESL